MSDFWTSHDPTKDGFYVVWFVIDEGDGYPPAEWSGTDRWENGHWDCYGVDISLRSAENFPDRAAAEAAERRVHRP